MIGQRGLPATHGGVERHVEELTSRLAARGHDVVVFCRREYCGGVAPNSVDGVRLEYPPTISTKHFEAFIHSGMSAAITVGRGFDIVHFHAVGPGLWSPIPRWLTGAKVVQTIHGLDQNRAKWGKAARVALKTGDLFSKHVPDAVIVVGRYLLDHYQERRKLTAHIPNGVTASSPPDDLIIDQLGLERRRYALFVGRLTPEKAVDQLISAFAGVRTDSQLVVVGGSSHTDEYERHIRRLAETDARVVLPGYVYGGQLAALYANAALYVQPSLLEGVPLTVLEAAATGLPLVLSDIPPHREVVPRTRLGARLFRAGDELALAAAMREGLGSAFEERPAADRAAEETRRVFDWERITEQTEDVYRQVLACSG